MAVTIKQELLCDNCTKELEVNSIDTLDDWGRIFIQLPIKIKTDVAMAALGMLPAASIDIMKSYMEKMNMYTQKAKIELILCPQCLNVDLNQLVEDKLNDIINEPLNNIHPFPGKP